jgi:hypothetical protein
MRSFEIKFEIFEDHIQEMKSMNLEEFQKKFTNIYGCFTLFFNGVEYLPYPMEDFPLETKYIYSELILTHFESLIEALELLNSNDYIAVKYIDNPWTWLEIIKEEDSLKFSEAEYENDNITSWIVTDKNLLDGAKYKSFYQAQVEWAVFNRELKSKCQLLLNQINSINPDLMKSKIFNKIKCFISDTLN